MLAITAINGVFVLLIVSYSPRSFAEVTKCYTGGSFEEGDVGKGDGVPTSNDCTTYCRNQTKGMLSTL